MAEGTIKKWFADRGYGFITPDDKTPDVKFFEDNLQEVASSHIAEGLRVRYELRHKADRPTTYKFWLIDLPAEPNYLFLNPYNFVRYLDKPIIEPTLETPDKILLWRCPPPPHDRYVGLTGRITCEVKAVTPLFVSDSHAIEGKVGEHRTYRFFQYDGQPALPASSLRGMFRSAFEAVTNSCFGVFQEDEPYPLEYRRSYAPDMTPARVVELGEKGGRLELLDCRINAPANVSGHPSVVRAGAVLGSYPPRVFNQRTGQTFNPDESRLPPDAYDGMRIAALVTRMPVPHRSKRYRAFQAEQIIPVSQHQSLIEDARLVKIFGWLHLTGPNIENKHDERLFFRWDDKEPGIPQTDNIPSQYMCECSSEVVAEYNHHLTEYWARLHRDVEELGDCRWPNGIKGVPHPSAFVEKGRQLRIGDLVYAQRDEQGNLMLRPVSMPRICYTYSRQSLLPNHLKKCQDDKKLCPACRVFGWVWDNPPKGADHVAYAGRVRFSHGRIDGKWQTEDDIDLAILSTPKPTTTAFYLLNPDGQPDASVTYDTKGARLRGRKFYRHQPNPAEYKSSDLSDQNRTVLGALKPGTTFTFTLDFENLAPLELGPLLYALELEEGMFHRLGYAKPLGFGSVKVTIMSVQTIDWETRLQSLDLDAGWQTIDWVPHKEAFLKEMRTLYSDDFENVVLADLRALLGEPPALPIHYPRPKKQLDPDHPQYEWFMGNKRRIGKHQTNAVSLSLAEKDTEGLPLIEKDGKEGQG